MTGPYLFWAFTIRISNTNTKVERELLVAGPLVRRFMELWDEGSNVQLRLRFDFIRPVGFNARVEIRKPLAGYIIADDDKEQVEGRYC